MWRAHTFAIAIRKKLLATSSMILLMLSARNSAQKMFKIKMQILMNIHSAAAQEKHLV
jgi:hypothetical protein